MKQMKTNCKVGWTTKLADLLLDPHAVPAKVQAHVAECERLPGASSTKLQATMELLDTWEAPEPSPYFLTRLGAGCGKSARPRRPVGWPAASRASAPASPMVRACMCVRWPPWRLTVVLLVGGGAYLGVTDWMQPRSPPRRPPWCTICKRSITMLKCWTRWKLSPATRAETDLILRCLAYCRENDL